MLDSDLIPNQSMVLDVFKHAPQSIAFQSTAYRASSTTRTTRALTKLMDLADPRLKGKLTLPKPTDITAGGLLLGLASEMGKDYKDPEQMKEVVDWAVQNLGPNVLKYTTDQATPQQLFESGARSTRSASGTASPAWSTSAGTRRRRCSCRRPIYRPTATCGSRRTPSTRCWPRSS